MEYELLGIGRLASLSGLTISALRFYDGAQVLRPSPVDPASGCRFYQPSQVVQARLVRRRRALDPDASPPRAAGLIQRGSHSEP